MKKIIAAFAAIVGLTTTAAVEWNTNFRESLAYAEANNIPIVVVWGNTSCSHCNELHEALDESAELEEWQSEHEVILVMKHEKYGSQKADYLAAKEWIKSINPKLSSLPFVGVYWKKADETVISEAFTGRDGTMYATTPKGNLAGQFVNSLDQLVGEYPPAPTGEASFVAADTETDRLEVVEDTQVVNVPVKRETSDTELKCTLKVKYPDVVARDIPVTWPIGVSNMLVSVELDPSSFDEGEKIALTLVDASGATMAKSSITMVEEPDNGMTNPAWLGESFKVGEWTMDLDAAKAKTAATSGDAYTFVMFTGALWCPWCQGLESGVLGTRDFMQFAKNNKINLVELDNPRRPANPEGPTGAPPTLLRYPAGNNSYIGKSVSGASYLSRKGIATEDAEAVLLRNHRLGYDGPDKGGYCAPEAARSGYPTIVLLRKDGSVAGRFNAYGPTTTSYDTAENMQRFEDFLYLAEEGDYFANWRTTTTRTLGLDEIQMAPFQINDTTEWFKLEGPFDEYITVACATERDVTLTITDADGKTIGQPAKNMLTISSPTNDVLYLKATCYEETAMYGSSSTRFTAAFTLTTSEEKPEQTVPFSTKSSDKAAQKYLNPSLYTKQSATVPLYEAINLGVKRLVGTLAVSVTAANKITAKFTGDEKTVSFSGTWNEISLSSGLVTTTLAKSVSRVSYTLDLAMTAKGDFEATVFADGERLGSGASAAGDVASYAGNYTVTLVDQAGEAGTGNLTVKITTAGKATVKGIMPDGTSISISAVVSPNVDGTASLPIYKASSKYVVSMALAIKPDADETWGSEGDKYTVGSVTGCLATYNAVSFSVFGGYWESTTPLDICRQYNLSDELDVVIGGETNDYVTATKSGFKVTKAVLQSLTFTKSTGAFSGKAKVYIEGRSANATVKGVLLPGWIDCKCGGEPVVERPYGSGTVYYKIGRTTVSLPIDLVAEEL